MFFIYCIICMDHIGLIDTFKLCSNEEHIIKLLHISYSRLYENICDESKKMIYWKHLRIFGQLDGLLKSWQHADWTIYLTFVLNLLINYDILEYILCNHNYIL